MAGVYCPTRNSVILHGGITEAMNFVFEDTLEYSIDDRKWKSIPYTQEDRPTRHYCHSMHLYKNTKIILFGQKTRYTKNDFWMFDTTNNTWEEIIPTTQLEPMPRNNQCSAVINDRLYIYGGWNNTTVFDDLHYYDLVNNTWTKVETPTNAIPLFAFTMDHVRLDDNRDYLLLYGGRDDTRRYNTLHKVSLDDYKWDTVDIDKEYPVRGGHKSVIVYDQVTNENHMIIFCGKIADEDYRSDVIDFKFDGYESTLGAHLKRIYNESIETNLTIHTKSKLFQVHSYIASQSKCLTSMDMRHVDDTIMDYVVRLLYGQELYYLKIFKEKKHYELINLLVKLDLVALVEYTVQQFLKFVRASNLSQVTQDAIDADCTVMQNELMSFELKNDVPNPLTLVQRHLDKIQQDYDITLVTSDDQSVQAHRALLCRCAYFETLFNSQFSESREESLQLPQVPIHLLQVVMKIIYTNDMGDYVPSTEYEIVNLYDVADFLGCAEAKLCCLQLWTARVTTKNIGLLLGVYSSIGEHENSVFTQAKQMFKDKCLQVAQDLDKKDLLVCLAVLMNSI
jgi:hypothetical protein